MLVLSRHRDQRIFIGDDIVITIVDILGLDGPNPKVRLGIMAPHDLAVDREEVRNAKDRERTAQQNAPTKRSSGL